MPIYEYKCENGHVFDVIQKMTDEPLHECQECGAPASRVLSAPAIHFKGSGFHNTDYGTRKRNREKESSGSNDAKPAEKKTESKSSDSSSSSSSSSASDS